MTPAGDFDVNVHGCATGGRSAGGDSYIQQAVLS